MNNERRNWLCYDADCPLCVRWVERFRPLLARHGFVTVPLQSAAVRAVLAPPSREPDRREHNRCVEYQSGRGLPHSKTLARSRNRPAVHGADARFGIVEVSDELLAEMRVITRDGCVFGGADALVYLCAAICRPLFELTRIPGIKPLLRTAYRFTARNRACGTRACGVRPGKSLRVGYLADWLPLLILPLAAAVIGRHFPAWLEMWAIAIALFAGCKWLCLRRELVRGTTASAGRKAGFLFGWIGMDADAFVKEAKAPPVPRAGEWLFAGFKMLIGAVLIWAGVRLALGINPLLAGWTGMVGLILLLHFGLFHLLALAWRRAEVPVTPLMHAPLLSRSLSEFWGERWNTAFNRLAGRFLFRPLHRVAGVSAATMLVFLVSGMLHDFVISVPARGGYGLPTLYFLLQGAGVLFERTGFARRCGLNRGFRGWAFTMALTVVPVFWLFHPAFVRNVILPFLKVIGAT